MLYMCVIDKNHGIVCVPKAIDGVLGDKDDCQWNDIGHFQMILIKKNGWMLSFFDFH